MGYSRRFCPPRSRTTAKFVPSGDQSAHCTPSRISRGAPPPSGTRASVPVLTKGSILRLPSSTAISGSRYREHLGVLQPEGTRFRTLRARGKQFHRFVFPGGAVQNCLAIGSEPCHANPAMAECKLVIDWGRNWRCSGGAPSQEKRARHGSNDHESRQGRHEAVSLGR